MPRLAHNLLLAAFVGSLALSPLSAQVPPGTGQPQPVPVPPAPVPAQATPIPVPATPVPVQPAPVLPPAMPVPAQPQPVPAPTTPIPTYDPGSSVGNVPFAAQPPIVPINPGPGAVPAGSLIPWSGFFGSLEIGVLFPEIHGTLVGPVNLSGITTTDVALGSSGFRSAGSPRLELGYRFGEDTGAVAISYRSFVSKGGEDVAGFTEFGSPFLSSLFNINVVDIDYVSPAYNIAPFWDFSWRGGLRVAGVYYQNVLTGTFGQAEATSDFVGAGPHAEVEVGRVVGLFPGLAVLAKLDGAVMGGGISQSFSESFQTSPPLSGESRFNHGAAVPMLTFNLGLSYTPPGPFSFARLGFGYQFEYWWDIGNLSSSKGDLLSNGFYFRGEFNF
jgi:hypothetical protein